jgi:Fe-S-cluster containining protein
MIRIAFDEMANFPDVLNHIYIAQALKMDTDLQCSFLVGDSSTHTKCFDLCTIVADFPISCKTYRDFVEKFKNSDTN